MPPDGPRLIDAEVNLLKRWIDGGLLWEEGFALKPPTYDPPLRPRTVELPPVVSNRTNPLDRILDAYFAEHKIDRPQPADDAALIRRLSLDLVGLLPPPDRVEHFLADRSIEKRSALVRELLADDVAYAEHWLTFWNDLLRNDYTGTGFITGGRKQITAWLYRSLVENKPYDRLVRELIAPTPESEGFIQGIRWRGTVSASQSQEVQFAQNISQAFLGINMKCASCHDSFIDHWKLSEAYGLAAIYAKEPLLMHRCDKPTGATAKAAWIFPELGQIDANAPQPERLQQLASLMTHPENGRFTRTIVNRLWHRLMGRGIVHPVDAMHTEPWSADLLDWLAVDFAEHGYDLKHTLKLIATSDVYQAVTPAAHQPEASARDNSSEDYLFRGPLPRRMTAEQFVDAVWQITAAAPPRPDAQVVRAVVGQASRLPSDKTDTSARESANQAPLTTHQALTARWIWSHANASQAPAGETVTFRTQFKLPSAPTKAVAVITCDNEHKVYANAQPVAADDNWESVEIIPLEPYLRAGNNEIIIVAKNAGRGPNAAGLIFEAIVKLPDGTETNIATNSAWQWTKAQPDARGRFKDQPTDWQPAVEIQPATVWTSRVGSALPAMLHQAASGPLRMVRASLVKSDGLMRSLGRPNRDQIVTMRPTDLTTLQAIELANGETLAAAIEKGATEWTPAANQSPAKIIDRLYLAALSRPPSDHERTAALEMLGAQPTAENLQDLLWAVLMLPEFQLIR